MTAKMKRREFITLLGGTALAWPLAARAQHGGPMRRVGVLTPFAAGDAEGQARLTAFAQGLQQAGWTVGQNIRLDYRWGDGKVDTMRKYAAELVALAPDVILASSSLAIAPLLETTRTVPIVFAGVADPVAAGYVESLARPGGNASGFTVYEYSIGGKWLELLKEVAPSVTRAVVLRESAIAVGPGQFGAIQALAPSLGVTLRPVDVRDAGEIERAITAFAHGSNGGMIVIGSPGAAMHRNLIIALAARHRLPAIYNSRFLVASGGLISYGADFLDQHRRAAGYVDRILKAPAGPPGFRGDFSWTTGLNRPFNVRKRTMSDEFDSLDTIEKEAVEAALKRCRGLAAQIAGELRNKRPEHFVDKLSLADFYASLECAANVLGQETCQSIESTPAPVVKGSQARALGTTDN